MDNNRLYIFDTTLRDGEQVPGCQLNTVEKVEVAKALEELGVDVIEAAYTRASVHLTTISNINLIPPVKK